MSRAAALALAGLTLAGLALAGCDSRLPGCTAAGGAPSLLVQLLFGRSIADREPVTAGEWRDFETGTLAPAFPAGFTVLDGRGRWLDAGGRAVEEPSVVVMIAAAPGPDLDARIAAVTAAYRSRFFQESVGALIQPVCAAF